MYTRHTEDRSVFPSSLCRMKPRPRDVGCVLAHEPVCVRVRTCIIIVVISPNSQKVSFSPHLSQGSPPAQGHPKGHQLKCSVLPHMQGALAESRPFPSLRLLCGAQGHGCCGPSSHCPGLSRRAVHSVPRESSEPLAESGAASPWDLSAPGSPCESLTPSRPPWLTAVL